MSVKQNIAKAVDIADENPRRTRIATYLLTGIVFVVLLPVVLPASDLSLLNRMLIWGLFAMAYDFMYGFSGMVSFGHAALFGLGAYSVSVPMSFLGPTNLWLVWLLAMLVAGLYAFIVGVIAIRTREVYFAILTLAFAEVIYILIINFTEITGGWDGQVVPLPELTIVPGVLQISMYDAYEFYFFLIVLIGAIYFLLRRMANSPMGAILRGVRENIERLEYIGIDERRYRIAAFTVSGIFSGLAGALYATDLSFVGPESSEVIVSGEVILFTILGGKGTLLGPLFGGAAVTWLEEVVSGIITWWLIPVGIIFILVVIFMPEGVAGKVKDGIAYLRKIDA